VLWALAGWLAGAGLVVACGLVLAAMLLAWQVLTLDTDDPANCLKRFKSNREVGWIFFLALVAQMLVAGRA
jgi:4-hydroxybenzoate polyprenyltransferase